MSESVEARANRIKLAKELCRFDPEMMEDHQLNLAMALVLKKDVRVTDKFKVLLHGVSFVKGHHIEFNPMENAYQLLEVISKVQLNLGSHDINDGEEDVEPHFWFSADAGISGTRANSNNSLNEAVGITIAKYLKSMMSWSKDWSE